MINNGLDMADIKGAGSLAVSRADWGGRDGELHCFKMPFLGGEG